MRVLNAHRDRIRLEKEIPNLTSFQLAFRSVKLYCVHHGLYSARSGYLGGIHIAILLTKIASRMPANAKATDLVRRCFHEYAAFDWAERFDDAVVAQLADSPADILLVTEHPDYELAVPTPDHFIPLLYLAGMAAALGETPEPLIRGYAMGSLSMTCYGVDAALECSEESGAAGLPAHVPPDQTNT